MKGTARLGDRTQGVCSHPSHGSPIDVSGRIVTASPDYRINNRGVARLGDMVLTDCGHKDRIATASAKTRANNRGIARLDDLTGSDGIYKSRIVTGSSDTRTN